MIDVRQRQDDSPIERGDNPGVARCDPWRRALPYAVAAGFFFWFTAYSVPRHLKMRSGGYDLGIFEQAVRGYAGLRAPIALIKGPGFNLLGDHFHPIIALLAPGYVLVPGPITLLVAQAALASASIVPLGRLAAERLGTWPGAALTLAYGMSWGIQQMIAFDFHEVCFALPLLSCALAALCRERWWAAALWASPLILVKEDLPLTVAAIGGYLILRGQRRLGAGVAAAGVASFAVIVTVILPAFNTTHSYGYWKQLGRGTNGDAGTPLDRVRALGTEVISGAIIADPRVHTTLMLLIPVMALALRSQLVVIALPTLAWRFASGSTTYWGTGLHYNAVLMPILFFAMLDALTRPSEARGWYARVVRPHARCLAVAALAVGLAFSASQPLVAVFDRPFWARDTRIEAARDVLALIPEDTSVAATNRLVPQLTRDHEVYLFAADMPYLERAAWVVVDITEPDWPNDPPVIRRQIDQLRAHGYRTVTERAGFILLTRSHQPSRPSGAGRGDS